MLHLSARQSKPSSTLPFRGAALDIKCCRSFGLPTPPPASSPQLARATKLPALTGKSMSKLARKPPSKSHAVGCEDSAARDGLSPGANDTTPATARVEDLNRASRRSDTLQFRARQADPIITCHYSRRQVHTQPLRRAALEGKSNPSKQHGVITTCRR